MSNGTLMKFYGKQRTHYDIPYKKGSINNVHFLYISKRFPLRRNLLYGRK